MRHNTYLDEPRLISWSGTATYPLLRGLITARIPEGGVLRFEAVDEGTHFFHHVYVDFPDTWRGRLMLWVFGKRLNGRQAVHEHAQGELICSTEKLQAGG